MVARPKPDTNVQSAHPVRPRPGPLNMKTVHDRIAARYPKILAKLAE